MLKNATKVPVEVIDARKHPYGCFTRTVERVRGECACGNVLTIEYDDGEGYDCICGRLYNLNGQELRPRSEWEEPLYEEE